MLPERARIANRRNVQGYDKPNEAEADWKAGIDAGRGELDSDDELCLPAKIHKKRTFERDVSKSASVTNSVAMNIMEFCV